MTVSQLLDTLSRRSLTAEESFSTFAEMVHDRLSDVEIAAILAALKTRGETPAELAGAARAMREAAVAFPRPDYPVADTCGTGGDGANTINVSTAAAFVAAAGGVKVAKHGNRATSSACGSADLLELLGVRLDPPPAVARRCLDAAGVCFLFAPAYHPGVRAATGVRRMLRTRTVFNLLGPLANPAHPEFQVMGIYAPHLVRPAAETLRLLGCRAALVVHGSGLDEIALHGETTAAWLHDGVIDDLTLAPEDAGVRRRSIESLRSGPPEAAGLWLRELLRGRGAPAHVDAVALNAGAMLWVAGLTPSLAAGAEAARSILASDRALARLDGLVEHSRGD